MRRAFGGRCAWTRRAQTLVNVPGISTNFWTFECLVLVRKWTETSVGETSTRRQQPKHLHTKVQHLALGWPWVRPGTLSLLPVEIEQVPLLICVLSPLRDFTVHVVFHLLHFHLQLVNLLVSFLRRHIRVSKIHNLFVRVAEDVFQWVGPGTHALSCVVVEDPIVAVEVLSPVARQGRLQSLHRNPKQVMIGDRVNAQIPRVGNQLWPRRFQTLPLLIFGLTDEVVYGQACSRATARHTSISS
mmetsp:Transcript_6511/g.18253  ORF Transcript_6511/g.18253 Transcript_6511/m.18253 type:complete len:243 (+) Transcript_6511:839-1567(+)